MKHHFQTITGVLLCAILLSSCGNAQPPISSNPDTSSTSPASISQMPDDFAFVYVYDFMEIDTHNDTAKNTYFYDEGDSTAITDFSFTEAQMQTIYEAFVEYGIHEMPEEIDPDKTIMAVPHHTMS